MPAIPDGSVDMILCDLPYGTTQCSWDTIIPLELLWKQYKRIIKPNGAIVLTASQPFTSILIVSNLLDFKYRWIWNKLSPTGHLNAHKQPMRRTEEVCVFYSLSCTYNPQGLYWNPRKNSRNPKTAGSDSYGQHGNDVISTWAGYPTDYIEFKGEFGLHPTQKPVALFEYLILTYTNKGEVVLDNCIGSGTTAIACIKTDRHYIGIEQEQKYVDIANERIRQECSQLKLEFP
jgi:site-specific DNA-methyltransferase (adenine-specific)